jgi:DNA polymerase-3 subunit epsilon
MAINFINLSHCYEKHQRMVVLDTETTGLSYENGDRLIEIGCVEIINNQVTGKFYQTYINPQRDVSPGSYRVTGIKTQFLYDKPVFNAIADDLLKFIGNDILIIHNANFDIPFLNYELKKSGRHPLTNPVLDTLLVSRELFAGKPCSLDAVCRRLNIDNTMRSFHGALLDSQILSKVYIMLLKIKKNQATIDGVFNEKKTQEDAQIIIKRNKISQQLVEINGWEFHQEFFNHIKNT